LTQLKADLPAARVKPSLRRKHVEAQRLRALVRDKYGAWFPIMKVNSKLAGYQFAASHGVPIPREIARCESAREIDWAQLPDSFVLKAVQGTSARGVMVLERRSGGTPTSWMTLPRSTAQANWQRVSNIGSRPERQAMLTSSEELLRSPYDDGHAAVPDIKLYCFYGTVGLIMVLRRTTRAVLTCRFFAPDDADLRAARSDRDHDPTLPEPIHLKHLVRLARPCPPPCLNLFVRLDF